MHTKESTVRVAVNRTAIAIATGVGVSVGFIPTAVLLDRVQWLPWFGLGAVVVSWLALRSFKALDAELPRLSEFALATLGAIFPGATASFLTIVAYWIVRGVVFLFVEGAQLIGSHLKTSGTSIGFYAGAFIALVSGLSILAVASGTIALTLDPGTTGGRSAYHRMLFETPKRLVVGIVVALGVLAVLAMGGSLSGRLSYLVLELYLITVSAPLWEPAKGGTTGKVVTTLGAGGPERAVARLLEGLGFVVVPAPRTGEERIDRLLGEVDLFAQRGTSAFVVEVKATQDSSAPVQSTEVSDLSIAAWTLTDARERLRLVAETVEPMMVFVGLPAPPALRKFADRASVRIVEIGDASRLERVVDLDAAALKECAEEILGNLDPHAAETAL